ncbi:OpgC family protein [Niveispirillum fermenti]|uniref:OpgC family protein n=1 Tax=Niveispirillum fermenti TaxID=1233113 RepID=UPI003A88A65F
MRDLRIDFFRGLALCAIFLNHIPGPATALTWRHYGFSDAADAFVFLAGFSAALAWGAGFRGERDTARAKGSALRRALHLYRAHLLLVGAMLVLVTAGAWIYANPAIKEMMALGYLGNHPADGWLRVALLVYLPNLGDILPMYIVFISMLALLGPVMARNPLPTFVLSALVWAWGGMTGIAPPAHPGGWSWFFNPLCWQFLFVIGFLLGNRVSSGKPLPHHPLLMTGAVIMVLYALLATTPWQSFGIGREFRVFDPDALIPHGKATLEIGRLLHFLSLAYIVSSLIRPDAGFLGGLAGRQFSIMGRHSLPVFAGGVLLSVLWTILIEQTPTTNRMEWMMGLSGLLILRAIAMVWEHAGPADRPAARPMPAPAPAMPVAAT